MWPASEIVCFYKLFSYINLNSSFPLNYNPFKWSLPLLSQTKLSVNHFFSPRVLHALTILRFSKFFNSTVYRTASKKRHFMVLQNQNVHYIYIYIYINFSQSTTIFLVYILFMIYNIRATSFGFMPSSGPL